MSDNDRSRRKNHFIKKGFQLNFSIRFMSLIIIEAVLLACLFWYLSLNTLTTSYQGSRLVIENTPSFFFPSMMYPGLIVIGVVGIIGLIGLIFISHKIAGPLYRFEKSLREISGGDLTHRVKLRKKDQLSDLTDTLNDFTSAIDKQMMDIKMSVKEMSKIMSEMQSCLASDEKIELNRIERLAKNASEKLKDLSEAAGRFRTSPDNKISSGSKGREA